MGKLIFSYNLFHNRKALKVAENKCFRKAFLSRFYRYKPIASVQGPINAKQWDGLRHFFSRNNSCFGLKLSGNEINREIFSLNNRCH